MSVGSVMSWTDRLADQTVLGQLKVGLRGKLSFGADGYAGDKVCGGRDGRESGGYQVCGRKGSATPGVFDGRPFDRKGGGVSQDEGLDLTDCQGLRLISSTRPAGRFPGEHLCKMAGSFPVLGVAQNLRDSTGYAVRCRSLADPHAG